MLKQIDCHGLSNVGRVRKVNEDQFLIADLNKSLRVHQTSLGADKQTRLFGQSQGKLLLVADGMGGHPGGARASSLVVDSVVQYLLSHLRWQFRVDETTEDDLFADLMSALKYCQTTIQEEARNVPGQRDMGTTVTLAYILWPQLYMVHVGDSRCYLFRQRELLQITKDHTVAQQGVDSGLMNVQQAEQSRWKHVLWNVVSGRSDEIKPDGHKLELQLDDTLLLCTDGLTGHVSNAEIADLLGQGGDAREVSQCLVDAAMAAGGKDNITVVVARFQDMECTEQQETAVLAKQTVS